MLPAQRRELLLAELQKDRFVTVNELVQRLNSSLSTVRRDLAELEREGIIVRTHGGAGLAGDALPEDMSGAVRAQKHPTEKQLIGRTAAELIDGMGAVILDAGTTTLEVARALYPSRPMRVVTDSLEIAWELKDRTNVTVILTGGIVRQGSYNLLGSLAEQAVMGLHAQVCVMGCTGLSPEQGLTKHDIEAVPVRRRMVENARQVIVVADSSKLGTIGLVKVCDLEEVNTLVTDAGLTAEQKELFEKYGVTVVIAKEEL